MFSCLVAVVAQYVRGSVPSKSLWHFFSAMPIPELRTLMSSSAGFRPTTMARVADTIPADVSNTHPGWSAARELPDVQTPEPTPVSAYCTLFCGCGWPNVLGGGRYIEHMYTGASCFPNLRREFQLRFDATFTGFVLSSSCQTWQLLMFTGMAFANATV